MISRLKPQLVHATRLTVFLCIVLVIRMDHRTSQRSISTEIDISHVRNFFPNAEHLMGGDDTRPLEVRDASDAPLGTVFQTSPASDRIVGFSGSTNVLIAFNLQDRILGIEILDSGDTREHLQQVVDDSQFMSALNGLKREQATHVSYDAVSGATLTSLAIQEAIAVRLGAVPRGSLRFPDAPRMSAVQSLFPTATRIEQVRLSSLFQVFDENDRPIGAILRSAPVADDRIGYQGPSDAIVGFEVNGRSIGSVVGVALGDTFDNSPYVDYVREDTYFRKTFAGLKLDDLPNVDLHEMQVEGVSGATMTSMNVADAVVLAAREHLLESQKARNATRHREMSWRILSNDFGTISVVVVGIGVALTRLRGFRRFRQMWQLVVIAYLGLMAGNLLSMAMLVGWAQHGIPTQHASGLICLAAAGLLLPVFTKRNVYCSHLCPHGAFQQMVRPTHRRRLRLTPLQRRWLSRLPAVLLVWCLFVALSPTLASFRLVDIEPFDAYHLRIAGIATITVAVLGLLASCFVPMGYCRFGCPTGSLLEFLRYHARADRWTARDWLAILLLGCAIVMAYL